MKQRLLAVSASILLTAAGCGGGGSDIDGGIGRWTSGGDTEVVGIHGALMSNGKVLLFGYVDGHHFVDELGRYQLWDPETRSPVTPSEVIDGWNPFCAGHCFLGDGRLFVAGGFKFGDPFRSSSADKVGVARIDDGSSVVWDRGYQKMEDLRWYPTVVTVTNGDCYIIGGSAPFAADNWKDTNEDVELFSLANDVLYRHNETQRDYPQDGAFDYPPGDSRQKVASGRRLAGLYPLTHLLPTRGAREGLLFLVTESFARLYDPTTNALVAGVKIDVGGFRSWWTQGSSVLLPLDIDAGGNGPDTVRIMLVGGGTRGDDSSDAPAWPTADIYRYTVSTQALAVERSVPLARPRVMGDAVLLPDGNVVVVGGAQEGYANENNRRVLEAELLRETTPGSWGSVELAAARTARGYHATTLLLPDGAIIAAGGNGGWNNAPVNEFKEIEVLEPPYLLMGDRPRILTAPDELRSGQSFTVQTTAGVEPMVVLVRHGSRTHSLDTDQRMLRLEAQSAAAPDGALKLTARMPTNPTYIPPGPYMLFVLRRADVEGALQQLIPSRAEHVLVRGGAECPDDAATALRVTIRTGGDDLRGGNDNAFVSFLESGATVVAEQPLNNGAHWRDFTRSSVSISLPAPVEIERLHQIEIRTTFGGGIGGDNWNIDRVTIHYRVGAGSWKHLWTETGNPVTRLTGDIKTWIGNVVCSAAAAEPGMTTAVRLDIRTGGDDLRSGSQAWASVLDGSNAVVVDEFALNGAASWANDSVHSVEEHLGAPVPIASLRKVKVRTNFGGGIGGDNWDIARLTAYYLAANGEWRQFLDLQGTPLARLTGDRQTWISDEPPPPPPVDRAAAVRVTVRTSGDDLRDRAWFSILDDANVVVPEFPTAGVSGWGNNSTHSVTSTLAAPVETARLNRVRIRTNFGGGIGGDNWNVDRVTVDYQPVGEAGWRELRTLTGSPLVRLTGNRKSWVGVLTE